MLLQVRHIACIIIDLSHHLLHLHHLNHIITILPNRCINQVDINRVDINQVRLNQVVLNHDLNILNLNQVRLNQTIQDPKVAVNQETSIDNPQFIWGFFYNNNYF